ncbi:MAG: TIGR00300 family protein [Planctomycetaceae bacterium]|nr:TIGR00300 family protein [Planctomycetaceae bacterium]
MISNCGFVEDVAVEGHIIDSLILPKILDLITASGSQFRIREMSVGQRREDASQALIEVQADSQLALERVLDTISDHGAVRTSLTDCRQVSAEVDGAFPEGFYCTTNQRTEVRVAGRWFAVQNPEMDCGLVVDAEKGIARCVPMVKVRQGDSIVVGHAGVRVFPVIRAAESNAFEFMNSEVSTEKPKGVAIRSIARKLFEVRRRGGKSLFVGGPAIVHTGSSDSLSQLVCEGYVNKLFAGNALATHDIEQAMFGTSLGVQLNDGAIVEAGHEHHLRAINRIRLAGGIVSAVEQGVLGQGVMHDCVKHGVDFLLAGSIRDDGPLPDVITDMVLAQDEMRRRVTDVDFCLMVATTLHSIAVGNLLAAEVPVVCVDINPSTVIKLKDRGSFQTIGLVTDVAPFMRQLIDELKQLESSER